MAPLPSHLRFAWINYVDDWPELVVATNELEIRLRTEGRPAAGDMLLRAFATLEREMLELARTAAVFATAALREEEHHTRVRPDTEGGGGPRLADSLVAEPMPDQGLLPGSIGVADLELLDRNVPWWITNEIGSSARVGGRLFGFFYGQDDEAPPDTTQFRVHPLFQPGRGPVSGKGTIREPIPARRFIAKAVPKIDAFWKAEFRAAKDRFDNELARVLGTYH